MWCYYNWVTSERFRVRLRIRNVIIISLFIIPQTIGFGTVFFAFFRMVNWRTGCTGTGALLLYFTLGVCFGDRSRVYTLMNVNKRGTWVKLLIRTAVLTLFF